MSRRNQRKAKEQLPAEEREDTESDSSSFDKDYVIGFMAEELRKMDENLATRFETQNEKSEKRNEDFRNEITNGLMKLFRFMQKKFWRGAGIRFFPQKHAMEMRRCWMCSLLWLLRLPATLCSL